MAFSALSTPFQDDTCSFAGCHADAVNRTASTWDIVNPVLLFADEGAFCQYANVTSCCSLDSNSAFRFLKPFCIDLLPFSIFYCLIRIVVSIVNYLFIYRKKILDRLKNQQNSLLEDRTTRSQFHYINYFKSFLRTSFILDIFSSLFSFWIFKGYQYYASQYSANPQNDSIMNGNFALLGDYTGLSAENQRQVIILFISVLIWFCLECWKTYIQIFSVSSLTHLDKLKRDTQNHEEQNFYKTHRKFAFWWTVAFFSVGVIFLVPNFFWKMIFGTENFQNYKLYYKYYSINTVSFWLSYTLIIILILTDRILAYDGFKKRQEFRASERRRTTNLSVRESTSRVVNLNNYHVSPDSVVYQQVKQTLKGKFPDKSQIELEELTQQVTDVYNIKMKDHFLSLKRKVNDGMEENISIETSMDYVRYLRGFNILNLIGYALILFSYQRDTHNANYLSLYMIGFIISAVSTFGFELTHNYLLYRSYFLQILLKMNRRDDS